jgi:hypothetical protein
MVFMIYNFQQILLNSLYTELIIVAFHRQNHLTDQQLFNFTADLLITALFMTSYNTNLTVP